MLLELLRLGIVSARNLPPFHFSRRAFFAGDKLEDFLFMLIVSIY